MKDLLNGVDDLKLDEDEQFKEEQQQYNDGEENNGENNNETTTKNVFKPPVLTLSDIRLEVRIKSIERILVSLMQKVSSDFFLGIFPDIFMLFYMSEIILRKISIKHFESCTTDGD